MPRGGKRQGKPGASYTNRTDLALGPRQLPVSTAPNQPYGAAKQQADAQAAVPMASGPLTQTPDIRQAAADFQPPAIPGIGDPSMNPGEHVTTGMNAGIGQTTPTQGPLQPSPVLKGVAVLNALGDDASPDVKAIRDVLSAAQGNAGAP